MYTSPLGRRQKHWEVVNASQLGAAWVDWLCPYIQPSVCLLKSSHSMWPRHIIRFRDLEEAFVRKNASRRWQHHLTSPSVLSTMCAVVEKHQNTRQFLKSTSKNNNLGYLVCWLKCPIQHCLSRQQCLLKSSLYFGREFLVTVNMVVPLWARETVIESEDLRELFSKRQNQHLRLHSCLGNQRTKRHTQVMSLSLSLSVTHSTLSWLSFPMIPCMFISVLYT